MKLQQQLSSVMALPLIFICSLNAMHLSEFECQENSKEQLTDIDIAIQKLSRCGVCGSRSLNQEYQTFNNGIPNPSAWNNEVDQFVHKECAIYVLAYTENIMAKNIPFQKDTHEYIESLKIIKDALKNACDPITIINKNLQGMTPLQKLYLDKVSQALLNHLICHRQKLKEIPTSSPLLDDKKNS